MDELPQLPPPAFETLSIHHAEDPRRFEGAIVPPIFQNSLFTFESVEDWGKGYHYTRDDNPTTEIVEKKLAAMEQGEQGRCFASGMAAATSAILSRVKAGEHVVAVRNCYGGVQHILQNHMERLGISATFVPGTELSQFERATLGNTKAFYLESPTSCFFELQDIEEVCAFARSKGIATIIDNTYSTPYFQNPLTMGVDLVLHSASKYLGGHADIIGGVVVGRKDVMEGVRAHGIIFGGMMDPFAAWLMLRGIRTLPIRLERHQQNALKVAEWLEGHPAVERVNYPGLASHPQAALVRKQMRGTSGLLSFLPKTTDEARIAAFMNSLVYFRLGCSWGGFESLAVRVGREEVGPGHAHTTVRLHVGLEGVNDLIADLDRAMRRL
jgi:cystathionine gamma-lyase